MALPAFSVLPSLQCTTAHTQACHDAEVQASDLLESALSNFAAARKGTAALLHSSLQSQLLTEDKVRQMLWW